RSLEAVVELVSLPHVVVGTRRIRLTMLRVHLPPDHPDSTRAPLDPDDDALGAPAVVATGDDAFGEPSLPRGSLHATTIQSATGCIANGTRGRDQGGVLVPRLAVAERGADGAIRDPRASPRPAAARHPRGSLRDEQVLARPDR